MLPRGIFCGIPLRARCARAVSRALSKALAAVASWRRGAAGEGAGVAAAIGPGERAWARVQEVCLVARARAPLIQVLNCASPIVASGFFFAKQAPPEAPPPPSMLTDLQSRLDCQ
jgi:hypothetical protein